jgi:hypothetical protein
MLAWTFLKKLYERGKFYAQAFCQGLFTHTSFLNMIYKGLTIFYVGVAWSISTLLNFIFSVLNTIIRFLQTCLSDYTFFLVATAYFLLYWVLHLIFYGCFISISITDFLTFLFEASFFSRGLLRYFFATLLLSYSLYRVYRVWYELLFMSLTNSYGKIYSVVVIQLIVGIQVLFLIYLTYFSLGYYLFFQWWWLNQLLVENTALVVWRIMAPCFILWWILRLYYQFEPSYLERKAHSNLENLHLFWPRGSIWLSYNLGLKIENNTTFSRDRKKEWAVMPAVNWGKIKWFLHSYRLAMRLLVLGFIYWFLPFLMIFLSTFNLQDSGYTEALLYLLPF